MLPMDTLHTHTNTHTHNTTNYLFFKKIDNDLRSSETFEFEPEMRCYLLLLLLLQTEFERFVTIELPQIDPLVRNSAQVQFAIEVK
jgi:hypothetical protein